VKHKPPKYVAIHWKKPGASKKYSIDWTPFLELRWRPNRDYVAGTFRRPSISTGFEYECTTGGKTAKREPSWPTAAGVTVTDGQVVWTARATATSAQDTLATSVWVVDTGPTKVSEAHTAAGISTVQISGGSDGEQYEAINTITYGTETEVGKLLIKVSDKAAD